MPKCNRNGNRKRRNELGKRKLRLGYYYIISDTEETEKNYFEGLRDSIPQDLRGHIKIEVDGGVKTKDLLEVCLGKFNELPQYAELWIVLDRDEVPRFDDLVFGAKRLEVNVAWSNPCFEIWMDAYFENMRNFSNAAACTRAFGARYKKVTGHEYNKHDKDIYKQLNKHGNEEAALSRAAKKLIEHKRNGKNNPTEMCPGTTVHELVGEIKSKVGSN